MTSDVIEESGVKIFISAWVLGIGGRGAWNQNRQMQTSERHRIAQTGQENGNAFSGGGPFTIHLRVHGVKRARVSATRFAQLFLAGLPGGEPPPLPAQRAIAGPINAFL